MDFLYSQFIALAEIVLIDVVLAGDNAVVVGMAAARVAPELRTRVIFWGLAGAVGLRILFAGIATQLLAIIGLTLAGGILLLWVCWKMYEEIIKANEPALSDPDIPPGGQRSFTSALTQIIVADVSMSLDNVLAVAGAAKGNLLVLAIGLALAIILMAVVSTYIARMLGRYPWITWIGLLVIVHVAADMIWDGSHEVACQFVPKTVCDQGLFAILKNWF